MFISRLTFKNIRNHKQSTIFPSKLINIFCGPNGSGKTSILEAISIGSFTKSFVTNYDSDLVRFGETSYFVELETIDETDIPFCVKIFFRVGKKKEIRTSSDQILTPKELIGRTPVVILSPDMRNIIVGEPSFRRNLMDKIISQISHIYIHNLIKHKNILKQRNKLLNDMLLNIIKDYTLLDLWTDQFINTSSIIISRRKKFFDEFRPFFVESYSRIGNNEEQTDLIYEPFGFDVPTNFEDEKEIKNKLTKQYLEYKDLEIKRGVTLFGPQKDDFKVIFKNKLASEVASQGQIKSLLVALKYAEIKYLHENKNATPIVLFDDIFSELDLTRIERVLELLSNLGAQTFITLTDEKLAKKLIEGSKEHSFFFVENGEIKEEISNKI
ncbi:MAG: DNA replication and repair protein RecF [Ignavibacteria bacterium]|nr:DNA replication and repair protein RecF [Ignavibacteria bacterium]